MKFRKILPAIGLAALVGILAFALAYHRMTPRAKGVTKSLILKYTGIADSRWTTHWSHKQFTLLSPELMINDIYKSMEGPTAVRMAQLSPNHKLLWLTGFDVSALDAKTHKKLPNDFVCHTNFDINEVRYYDGLGLANRIGTKFPRITSLSHGMESFHLPKGYGIPMRGDDLITVTTESLNHNIKDTLLWLRHQVDIDYSETPLKPLMMGNAFIMLPYDKYDPYKEPLDPARNYCIPVETGAHHYEDNQGRSMSGHWVIPVGKNTYRSNVDAQLQIKDSLRLHAAAIHVHPFATKITFFDQTKNAAVFTSHIINKKGKIGIESIEPFASEAGVWLYANHHYEIVLEVDNTSKVKQDMMGTMFLFYYDKELDEKLQAKKAK